MPQCGECKDFFPFEHEYLCPVFGKRTFDGICRFDPHTEHKNKNMTCGKFKNAKAPVKRKTKQPDDESKWTDNFKAYMDAHPRYIDPDGTWKVWVDLELEGHAEHIIKQAKQYALTVQGEVARYITKNKNWLMNGGWKSHYDDVKSDSKACIDCGAPYVAGEHKYASVDGKTDTSKFRCKECRTK